MNETFPTFTLDGAYYALSELTQRVRETLLSIRIVEAKLQHLQGEMAVSQTAYVAYAPILNAELEQLAAAEKE